MGNGKSHFYALFIVKYKVARQCPQTTTFFEGKGQRNRAEALLLTLIVRDKVTKQCPQTTTFEERGEPKRNRTEVLLLMSQCTNALPLGRAGSQWIQNIIMGVNGKRVVICKSDNMWCWGNAWLFEYGSRQVDHVISAMDYWSWMLYLVSCCCWSPLYSAINYILKRAPEQTHCACVSFYMSD